MVVPDFATVEAMRRSVARIVVPRDDIARKVEDMADEIARCYGGSELTILAVLTGSLIFLSDLIRNLPLLMRLDVVSVCSYPDQATRSRGPRFTLPATADLEGRNVLVVDDILDSGRTLRLLLETVRQMHPSSVRTCVLLRKEQSDRGADDRVEPDFVGFELRDEFVVGYGLDYDNLYRNLPDICVLKGEVVTEPVRGVRE